MLIDDQTGDKHVVLVKQQRICNGSSTYEHPAGMIDQTDFSPLEVAERELKEETQLVAESGELKPLFHRPLFSATTISDEALPFFYLERRMALTDIKALHGRLTGEAGEYEHTQLYVANLARSSGSLGVNGLTILLLKLRFGAPEGVDGCN